ncbi:MAG: glutathione S-transferase family protein [Oceanospirillaceae bacterium]|nr:glutathione S-transferase family protein [Oceanospirillaceae bacterium]
MKLYGMGVSRSFRALWAAQEAGVELDYIIVAFGSTDKGGAQSNDYKQLNYQGKVPTLVDGDLVLTESAAVINYLANKAPQQNLIPKDGTSDRAKYDQMCYFIVTELEQPLWSKGKHKFALPEQYRVPDLIDRTLAFEFAKAQSTLLGLKSTSEFAVGDHFTMADVLLTQTLNWAQRFEFEIDASLLDYKERMMQREAYSAAMQRTAT